MEKNLKFCQQASAQYEKWLEEEDDDPRIVASKHIACEWRTPYHLAPGKETVHFDEASELSYGEFISEFINGLSRIDELKPSEPLFLEKAENISEGERRRKDFFDNMNA